MTAPRGTTARRRGLAVVFATAGITTFGALPVFLLGGLSVLVRRDLVFTEARMGMTVAVFFLAAALGSAPAGRIADRVGAHICLGAGLLASITAMGTAAVAPSWLVLTLALGLGGFGHAVLQVAANLLLTGAVPTHRQGVAFGIKQSAIPIATLIAGVALPLVATRAGWRPVYLGAATLAVVALLLQRRMHAPAPKTHEGGRAGQFSYPRRDLVILAFAVGCGAGVANALAAFLVDFAVNRGVPVGQAGLVLAVASAAGLGMRVLVGWIADIRGSGGLGVVAGMLLAGGCGFAALPLVDPDTVALWLAAVVAFGAGWGWPGLFTFVIAKENPYAPAAATGVTQAGIFSGAVVGPLAFGFMVTSWSYTAAWLVAAVTQFIGAGLVFWVRHSRRAVLADATADAAL